MAFRVLPDGTIETDSLEEALRAREALNRRRPRQARGAEPRSGLTDNTRRLLQALLDRPEGLLSADLAARAGLSTRQFPPILRGLGSWSRKRRLKLEDLLTREPRSERGKPVSHYKLTEQGRGLFGEVVIKALEAGELRKADSLG